jgi:hypothetical protein
MSTETCNGAGVWLLAGQARPRAGQRQVSHENVH